MDEFELLYTENLKNFDFEGLKYNLDVLQRMDSLFTSLNIFFEKINCNEEGYQMLYSKMENFEWYEKRSKSISEWINILP